MIIRPMQDDELETVVDLWKACNLTRPHNNPHDDIALARAKPSSELLVGLSDDKIIASVMVGHDGHRGWVYYVSAAPEIRNQGIGKQIMTAAEDWLKDQGIWKLNLMIRTDNADVQNFYSSIGYDSEDRAVMAKWLDPAKKP